MKTQTAIIILLVTVVAYENFFASKVYEPIDFYSPGGQLNNHGAWYAWENIRGEIKALVDKSDFDELENRVNEVRVGHYKFSNSNGVLQTVYNEIAYSLPDYEDIHAFAQRWRAYDPKSNIPDILDARAHRAHAQEERGNGYVSYVSDSQFRSYRKYLNLAYEAAQRAEQIGPMDAELCREHVELAFVHLKNKRKAKEIYKQCQSIDLSYIHLYYTMRTYLQRIWYGSDRELQQFIEQAADDTKHIYGEGLYAMLVAAHSFNTRKIFAINRGSYSWPRAKAGFQHLFQKFGDSSYIWHEYGYCAMLAEDYEAFRVILDRIGTDWDDEKERIFIKRSWFYYHVRRSRD